ncbi:MAG: outer membrane protein assembly factor BamB family protein [Planctomycetota bacterium]|jgi:outer membrane protein assembly factor BamB
MRRTCSVALALFAFAAGSAGQEDASGERFAGWDTLRDAGWRFDPDDRPVLGYAVRDTTAARAALDAAETALRDGDAELAARLYSEMVSGMGDQVLQVAGEPPRWVGAGEWALYQLSTRVPAAARAGSAQPVDRDALAQAIAWRDLPALRRLAWRLEGLPEGGRAATLVARLLAERGSNGMAHAAAGRALQLGADGALSELSAHLATPPTPPAPGDGALPTELRPLWNADFVVSRLEVPNPFEDEPDMDEAPMAPIRPVVRDGVAYVADSLSVTARDLLSGRALWHHAGPMEVIDQDPTSPYFRFRIYVDYYRERAVSPYQFAAPAVTDSLVIAAVQVPELGHTLPVFDSIPINWPLPRRRLVALDRATGALAWEQERPEAGEQDFRNAFDVAGPPTVVDGVVYAAGTVTLGSINSYVAAFDLSTGDLLWRTLLCAGQQDLTMFNRPFQEHTASPPLVSGGSVYVSSNLGVVACVDAWSGRLRWLSSYTTTERRASRSPERDQRRPIRWANEPPVLDGGRLVVTPLDSPSLLVLDAATGRQLFSHASRVPGAHYSYRHQVVSLGNGLALVVGDTQVECLSLSSGGWKWERSLDLGPHDRISGPAVLVDDRLLVPSDDGLHILSTDGTAPPTTRAWEGPPFARGVRCVVPAGAVLLYHDNWALFAAVDVEGALDSLHARSLAAPEALLAAAELLLSTGRYDEAEELYDALLEVGDAALIARARSGRLETALRRARVDNEVVRWDALLASAERFGDPWPIASEALSALDALGAVASVEAWLERLAALDGDRRLALGPLTPEGSAPAGLLSNRLALPDDTPARAVLRLQEMLTRWPDEPWDGVRVRDRAATLIDDLLARHGRELYERFEREAEEALFVADDTSTAGEVSARYPNARVVTEARLERFNALLNSGHAREVLEELARHPPPGRDSRLDETRVRAARELGEHALADALAGRAKPAPPVRLPAVPREDAQLDSTEISVQGRISFPLMSDRPDTPWASCVLGMIHGTGEMFLLDGATGTSRWRRDLPGQTSRRTPNAASFLMGADRVFVHVDGASRSPERPPLDLIEAVSLADGSSLWARSPPGAQRGTVVAAGMVLRLHEDFVAGSSRFRLEGYGTASGVLALVVDLPACADAELLRVGEHVVVFTATESLRTDRFADSRLSVLDVAAGTLEPGPVLPVDFASVVTTLEQPPAVLLSSRAGAVGTGAWLALWDPDVRDLLWQTEVAPGDVRRDALFPTTAGRLLLLAGVRSGLGQRGTAQVLPLDALRGPLAPIDTQTRLHVLEGQTQGAVPRLVFLDVDDPGRLLVADGRTGQLRYEVRIPPVPADDLRVIHGQDGFVLAADPLTQADPVTLRVFDGESGQERYSVRLDRFSLPGRADLALVEGAVVLADAGIVHVIRSETR